MITKLTTEQEHRLAEYREEMLAVGLSCEPANFDAGDDVIRDFYARVGKPEPIILHFSSPAACELASNLIFAGNEQLYGQLDDQLCSQLGSPLRSQLGSQFYGQLRRQLRSQLRIQLESQLRNQLERQLSNQLRSQLDIQLYGKLSNQLLRQFDYPLRRQLGSPLRSQLESEFGGQLDSQLDSLRPLFLQNRGGAGHWLAGEAYFLFASELGVKYTDEQLDLLRQWEKLSRNIGWWAPWDGICIVSDRPRKVSFDATRLLHCETGPAVEYSDGWGCYAWHGTRLELRDDAG